MCLEISGRIEDFCCKEPPKSSARKVAYSKEEEDYADYDPSSLLEFYTEESNEDYRSSGYGYNPSSRMVHEAAGPLNYVMSPAIPPGPPPALNHYNYQYPAHAVLPPAPMAERPPYYHTPGQGLPFSEGQQLPQFHFHVASQVGKPPPPIMSSVASLSQGVPLPPLPPPPVSLHPSQPVIPPPSTSLSMPSPWPKPVGVPHAFQIPLSTPTPITASSNVFSQMIPITVPSSTPATSQSTLKNLLTKTPPAPSQISQIQQSTPTSQAASNFSIFTNVSKTPEISIQERSRCDSENAGTSDIDGDLEKEVMGDFKPLIPLPAEIVVETGEENEEVLFEDRAKLYRFVDQEWKERGLGIVKILHHNSSGRVRLLMRREQVLKVCANHYITPDMEILPLKNSDRAWTWVAQDFADEELKPEHFCIRFKTAELAIGFKSAFVKAINISKDYRAKNSSSSNLVKPVVSAIPEPFGAKYLPKAGSWNCPTCYVNNGADKLFCAACESKNPNSQTTISSNLSIASTTLPTTDSVSISKLTQDKPLAFNFGGGFKFDSNEKTTVSTSSNPPKNIFGGFTFSSSPTIRDTKSPEPKDREILVVSTKAKNGPQVTKVNSTSSPFSSFSFAKTPTTSSMAIHLSGDVRTVIATDGKKDVFGNAFSKPFSPVTSSTNIQSTTISSSNNENSLSKMQALVQNLTPAYTFETKEGSKIANPASTESKISTVTNPEVFDASKLSNDGSPEEFEPTVEFKPVVPLPALVEIKTGEEKEEVLFEERAKLFRYDSTLKEWKERGTGMLKILYLEENQKYRILMRRDQVLKICANHNILPEMKLTPLSKCDKAWVWFAKDYSDGDLTEEQFAAKFKNSDIAQNFFNIFEKCQNSLKSLVSEKLPPSDKCAGNSTAFDQLLKPAVNSWNCSKCQKSNMNESSCIYCKSPKADSTMVMSTQPESSNQKPLSEIFKPPIGSWECKKCYVRNKASDHNCASCESLNPYNPKLDQSVKQNIQKSLITEKKDQTFSDILGLGSWECQSCKIRNSSDKTKCNSCGTPKNGSSAPSTKESSSIFGNFKFGSSNTATSTFQFGNSSEFVFGVRPVTQPTTFTFGQSTITDKENESIGFKPSLPANNITSIFGGITQNTLGEKNNGSNKSSSSIFKNLSSPFTFGSDTSVQKTDSESVGFQFGSPQKYEFSFTGVRPRSPVKTPKSPRSPAAPSDADDDESDFDADNIYFQPAIPLPPKVDVKTGEEDENVLYCNRAKLFRFSSGEWKERGVGDIKILFDNKTRKARFLMRREQVLKVCLNHNLTKDLKFSIRGDKSWTWTATDFSESEPSPELFAIRFKTNELAEEFKKAIDDTLKKLEELQPVFSEFVSSEVVSKAASSFSFKVDTPTTSTVTPGFGFGALSSQFGISVKSVFGPSSDFNSENSSKAVNFSFTEESIFGQTFKFGSESSVVPAPESVLLIQILKLFMKLLLPKIKLLRLQN
ncbi:e3 SUMO-protein ligase RanBP2 [Caerostris extrusa]|uniref:E3 SUMO-protein ligase RanBP2 n=1 Tax=Caerostris extrusa TaxID=172846 RepID=A0AAV4NVI8_CAEEX|nr:e3 SUMO-protein ligase RanBP2 [Caerostris extrusa]